MKLNREEKDLFENIMVLSTDRLVPSMIAVNEDGEYTFMGDLYVTADADNSNKGKLHLRVYDGASDELDPSYEYEGKKVAEAILEFTQEEDEEEEYRFVFDQENAAKLVFLNGDEEQVKTNTDLTGLGLELASKLFFIDLIRVLLNSKDNSFSV